MPEDWLGWGGEEPAISGYWEPWSRLKMKMGGFSRDELSDPLIKALA